MKKDKYYNVALTKDEIGDLTAEITYKLDGYKHRLSVLKNATDHGLKSLRIAHKIQIDYLEKSIKTTESLLNRLTQGQKDEKE